jgi:uncharacterized protein (DUF362 family)
MDEKEKLVVILKGNIYDYPVFPFSPPEEYPELKSLPYKIETDSTNHIYEMIRKMFYMYGLNTENYGTQKWNPLSEIISNGDTVVIKPNLVLDRHPLGKIGVLSTITHSSLLRPIIDYAILALKENGKIVICDAPFMSTNFENACKMSGLIELVNFYKSKVKNMQVLLLDLRKEITKRQGHINKIVKSNGDPLGYTIIDLGNCSFHSETDRLWKLYAATGSLRIDKPIIKNLRKYHSYKEHRYSIPNTVLNANVIISVPKLKSHRKAGITAALKNFIGISGLKYLPHHKIGTPQKMGDEYLHKPSIYAIMKDKLVKTMINFPICRNVANTLLLEKHLLEPGAWHGNDTIWRTILDLNTIVKYVNKEGTLCRAPQRKFIFIVDGIIGQDGEGPIFGYPKKCGVTLLGTNPCAIDYVAAKLVGFDVTKLKQIITPFERRNQTSYPLADFDASDINVISNVDEYVKIHELKREKSLKFRAAKGWKILEVDRYTRRQTRSPRNHKICD